VQKYGDGYRERLFLFVIQHLTSACTPTLPVAPSSLWARRVMPALQIAKSYHKVFKTGAYCYISVILTTFQLVVISFFNRANPFSGVCLFCIFVTNTIYVIKIEVLEPVVLVRYL
jgi:hypothetical protein